ncbi:hypothetical protein [Maribacter sp. 2307ULW6-5]|uniref:hypothetical protein n=1 Tax=Maribacter sp. 2307ULW6-5 TaxID=3386275 RepID=UPI0039BC2964
MISLRPHIRTALGYFFMAALLGAVLRFFHVLEIGVTYKFVVHGHSHIALLGWVYLVLTTLIYKSHIQQEHQDARHLRIFWFTQVTLIGMLITFPLQGYAFFSILFSTLFLFASYAFLWFFLKHGKQESRGTPSHTMLKAALWYMALSSLGPWALGGIMTFMGPESFWYRMAIYFYLHFQYNAWMVMALLGLFFYLLEKKNIVFSPGWFRSFFWQLNAGVLLSVFLSALFQDPPWYLYLLGGMGAVLQLLAFLRLGHTLFKTGKRFLVDGMAKWLFWATTLCLGIKMVLQLLSALPYFAQLANVHKDLVIGYLHWTFLGALGLGLLFLCHCMALLTIKKWTFGCYLLGFLGTEILIFYRGIAAWLGTGHFAGHQQALAWASMLMALAVAALLFTNLGNPSQKAP